MSLTVGSLFSGIEGLGLGLERAGCELRWHAEIDPYCCSVLEKHWPMVPNYGDVTEVDWTDVPLVDVLCGGFPCQPVSYGGLRGGQSDDRWLWPAMAGCLSALRPRYCLMENVPGLLTLGFDDVLSDLAALGYDAEWSVVSACAMGATHTRERLYVLAYPEGTHVAGALPSQSLDEERWAEPRGSRVGEGGSGWWLSEPRVDRMADGIPRRLVRAPLEATGNAVVPQVAEFIGSQLLEQLEVRP